MIVTVGDPFRTVFASHPMPMWIVDGESAAIIDVNEAALAYHRTTRDEFMRGHPVVTRHAAATPRHEDHPDDVGVVSQAIDFDGRTAMLVMVHDLRAQRAVERDLERAEQEQRRLTTELEERVRERTVQLQAAVSELEAFSYSVSHDLRAPLRSIAGFSQALIEDAGPQLSPDAQDDVSRIVAAAQRMDHLINDLLTLSMVTRAEMSREVVDVSDLANRIVAELAEVAPMRGMTTTVRPGMTAPGDPRLVRVALENLITNAWKFTSRREHPCIEVGQASDDGSSAVFFIRDNGVGFDPTYADKLFGPFQRLHDATEFPGTGIGLATVRRIVLRHGGRVWAESQPGQGACFYFTLQ